MDRPFFRFSVFEPMDSDVVQVFCKFYSPDGFNYLVSISDGKIILTNLKEQIVSFSEAKPFFELRFGYEANTIFLNCLNKSLVSFLKLENETASEIKGKLQVTKENESYLKGIIEKIMQKSGLINEVA